MLRRASASTPDILADGNSSRYAISSVHPFAPARWFGNICDSVLWCISNFLELLEESVRADTVYFVPIWLIWLKITAGAIWRSIWYPNSGQKRTSEALKILVLQAELLIFWFSNLGDTGEFISLRTKCRWSRIFSAYSEAEPLRAGVDKTKICCGGVDKSIYSNSIILRETGLSFVTPLINQLYLTNQSAKFIIRSSSSGNNNSYFS